MQLRLRRMHFARDCQLAHHRWLTRALTYLLQQAAALAHLAPPALGPHFSASAGAATASRAMTSAATAARRLLCAAGITAHVR